MAEDQQISGDVGDQGAAGDGSRQRLVIVEQEPGAVHLGGNVHGKELIVPAGHTWAVQGDVRIGDGAVLKIEDGATLQVKGPPSAGLAVQAAPASSADDRQGGQGKRMMILQAPAELEPGELERRREQIRRYGGIEIESPGGFAASLLEPPTSITSLLKPPGGFAASLLEPPTSITSLLKPPGGFAASLLELPDPLISISSRLELPEITQSAVRAFQESQTAWAERMTTAAAAAIEPAVLRASDIFRSAAIEQMADLSADTLSAIGLPLTEVAEMMRRHDTQIQEAFTWASTADMVSKGLSSDFGAAARMLSDLGEVARWQSDAGPGVAAALKEAARWQSDLDMATRALGAYRITQAGVLVEIAPRPPAAPAVVRLPEPRPPAAVEVVSLPAVGNWREALTLALTSGQASPEEISAHMYSLTAGQRQAGLFPPEWQVIAAVVAIYKTDGRKHTYSTFVTYLARKGIDISVATFKRWLETYENHTGEQVRPGRGRRGGRAIVS